MAMGYLEDMYGGGLTRIWYNRDPECLPSYYGIGKVPEKCRIDVDDLRRTHAYLGNVPFEDLETVWMKMQAEQWSVEGEARDLIVEKGLAHTSMSIGDIVESRDGSIWQVGMLGFKKIKDADLDE